MCVGGTFQIVYENFYFEQIWNRFGRVLEQVLKIDLNISEFIILLIAILNIEVFKKIIEKIPEDFEVEFDDGTNTIPISDKIQFDVSGKTLIFRKY